jgi:hypothetical protein
VKRWPLFLIAAPAAVAIWSGWVALGELCGFGLVTPLPGILPGFRLNTAITLPVGVEAYGAYALGAWLSAGTPERARVFARRSAIGALSLGVTGQVISHLLAAAHAIRAPWPVVVLVSCLPVVTLGFGAAMAHLLNGEPEPQASAFPSPVPGTTEAAAEASLRATHAAGNPWSVNQLKERFSLTRTQATRLRQRVLAGANGHTPQDTEGDSDE